MYAQSVLKSGSFAEDSNKRTSTVTRNRTKACPIMEGLGYDPKTCTCDWSEVRDLLSENVSCVNSHNECRLVSIAGLTTKIGKYRERMRMLKINRGRTGRSLSTQEMQTYKKQTAQMEQWFKQIALALTKRWLT